MDNNKLAKPPMEQFLEWRTPRYGTQNPTKINSELLPWIVENKLSAYTVNQEFGYSNNPEDDPTWSFGRNGQTTTLLEDGRTIYIGGEYEDSYDPDFKIYNDIIVKHPSGDISIYNYPREIFPPTDFHTATLVNGSIIIIGSLGYHELRRIGHTQVFSLNINTYEITKLDISGTCPGWIHEHCAELSDDKTFITIIGGEVACDGERVFIKENIEDWRLNLNNFNWEKLTNRNWKRIQIKRKDCGWNHLWEYRQLKFSRSNDWNNDHDKEYKELGCELGMEPNLDLLEKLYRPPIKFEVLPEREDEHKVHRIIVENVVVRFVEDDEFIQVTIEGDISVNSQNTIENYILKTLSVLENCESILERY